MDFTIPAGSLKTLIDTIATWLTFVLKLQQPHIHRTSHMLGRQDVRTHIDSKIR